jgi:hypothetical protein
MHAEKGFYRIPLMCRGGLLRAGRVLTVKYMGIGLLTDNYQVFLPFKMTVQHGTAIIFC